MSKEYRSNEEKLEILKAYANSKRDDLVQLDKRFNFHDKKVGIRGRVKLFRDSLLKHGYYEQLIEEGISVNIKETPKLGSKLTNNQKSKLLKACNNIEVRKGKGFNHTINKEKNNPSKETKSFEDDLVIASFNKDKWTEISL